MEAKDKVEETKVDASQGAGATQEGTKMPIDVVYCPHCTFPAEFCEYSSTYDKCRAWLQEHYPHLVKSESEVQQQQPKKEEAPKEETKTDGTAAKEGEEKPAAPKKVGFKEEKVLELLVKKRGNKKFLTVVSGLEAFGINPKDAAKKFGKKFACGSSVIENNAVEIQGDVTYELMEYIPKEYPEITEDVIVVKEKK